MAHYFRQPDRKQMYLLPVAMLESVPEDDIVHLVLDVVEGMDLAMFESNHDVSGTGKPRMPPP